MLLENRGGDQFVDATPPAMQVGYARGAGWADLDSDGDLDLAIARFQESAIVFRNNGSASALSSGGWLAVDLYGSSSDVNGVGASVSAYTAIDSLRRDVKAGGGFASQDAMTSNFGLGGATAVQTLDVHWPYADTPVQSLAIGLSGHRIDVREYDTSQSWSDNCLDTYNPEQSDLDGDGRGDACDCQASDPGDRRPPEVATLSASRGVSGETQLTWSAAAATDAYQVTRGSLRSFTAGDYGACAAQGIFGTAYNDVSVPPVGGGFFYLVAGQNFDCGGGSLGTTSEETERSNSNPGACAGIAVAERFPNAEAAVAGTVTGTFADVATSNNVRESIQETVSQGGNPGSRYTFLEHRWTIAVAAGSRIELHVEGSRTNAGDGDNFRFEWSLDGATWTDSALPSLPTVEAGDLQVVLPASLSGQTVQIRVIDTVRTAGTLQPDTVSIDQLWIRSIP